MVSSAHSLAKRLTILPQSTSIHDSKLCLYRSKICIIFRYCLWTSEIAVSNPPMPKTEVCFILWHTDVVFLMTGMVSIQCQNFSQITSTQSNPYCPSHKSEIVWDYLGNRDYFPPTSKLPRQERYIFNLLETCQNFWKSIKLYRLWLYAL